MSAGSTSSGRSTWARSWSCRALVIHTGRTSLHIAIDIYARDPKESDAQARPATASSCSSRSTRPGRRHRCRAWTPGHRHRPRPAGLRAAADRAPEADGRGAGGAPGPARAPRPPGPSRLTAGRRLTPPARPGCPVAGPPSRPPGAPHPDLDHVAPRLEPAAAGGCGAPGSLSPPARSSNPRVDHRALVTAAVALHPIDRDLDARTPSPRTAPLRLVVQLDLAPLQKQARTA